MSGRESIIEARCHCGEPAPIRGKDDPWEGRMDGYCYACSQNRCDCYPDECPVRRGASGPRTYAGNLCTRRNHVVATGTISESDTRLHACDCRLTLIGNGRIEIRYGLLPHLFSDGPDE